MTRFGAAPITPHQDWACPNRQQESGSGRVLATAWVAPGCRPSRTAYRGPFINGSLYKTCTSYTPPLALLHHSSTLQHDTPSRSACEVASERSSSRGGRSRSTPAPDHAAPITQRRSCSKIGERKTLTRLRVMKVGLAQQELDLRLGLVGELCFPRCLPLDGSLQVGSRLGCTRSVPELV